MRDFNTLRRNRINLATQRSWSWSPRSTDSPDAAGQARMLPTAADAAVIAEIIAQSCLSWQHWCLLQNLDRMQWGKLAVTPERIAMFLSRSIPLLPTLAARMQQDTQMMLKLHRIITPLGFKTRGVAAARCSQKRSECRVARLFLNLPGLVAESNVIAGP